MDGLDTPSEAAKPGEAKSIHPVSGAEVLEAVPGYPDYKVSPAGYVVSYKKYRAGQRLKSVPNNAGAVYVFLYDVHGNRSTPLAVSRIVAKVFIPNPYRLPNVAHKDGNKFNNAVSNLFWADDVDTHNNAINAGRYDNHYKINDSTGARIVEEYKNGARPTDLARKYKVNRQTIYWWVHGKKHWGAYLAEKRLPQRLPQTISHRRRSQNATEPPQGGHT